MKIKDVIVSEATPKVNKGTAAGYKGTAGAQAIAQASGIKDVNQIKAGQTINIPGVGPYTVKPGDTLDKIAAANKVGAQPAAAPAAEKPADAGAEKPAAEKPAADASAPTMDPVTKSFASNGATLAKAQGKDVPDTATDTETGTEPTQATMAPAPGDGTATDQPAPSADLDRLKYLAIGGQNQANQQASQIGQGYADAAKAPDPNVAPQANALGVMPQANVGPFGANNQQGQGTQPNRDASTVPDAAKGVATTAPTNPDTGLSTVPGQLQSRGGPTNVKTASQDEYAWRAKNPNWNMTGAQYPGPGQWDPKTGRSKKDIEQGQKNADAVKGFFNKLNPFAKKEPTVNVGPGSPNYQANPAIDNLTPDQVNQQLKQKESVDLDIIRKLSGLK